MIKNKTTHKIAFYIRVSTEEQAESLAEEGGSDGLPIAVQNKTAIGLFWKEQLPGSKDNERVDTAADDHEDQRDDDRCFDFFEKAHGNGPRERFDRLENLLERMK